MRRESIIGRAREMAACSRSRSRQETGWVVSDRQSSRVAVCHEGLVSERGQITNGTRGRGVSRDKSERKEEDGKKMTAPDAIDRMRGAPGEEKT